MHTDKMDVHHRFMNASTSGIAFLLDTLGDNRESTIRESAEKSNEKISNGAWDIKTLETLRSILCYEYQATIDSFSKANVEQSQSQSMKTKDFDCKLDIKSFFVKDDENWSKEELVVLYDILVGQLALRYSLRSFFKLFDDFYETQRESLATSNETQGLCMRVSECFVDSVTLRCRLHKSSGNDDDLEKQRCHIEAVIKLWLKQETNIDWRLLASLLPKLAIVFRSEKIVSFLWDDVVGNPADLGNTLSALCVMGDICFPCGNGAAKEIHFEQCIQKQFWSILLQGLLSGVSQHRKQALYLTKRAVDFMDLNEPAIRGKLDPSKESIVPFKCARLPSADPSIDKIKTSFFLILEVLEEKQKHLVLPALSNLPILLRAYVDHKACGDCFTVAWFRCILQRVMQHDNDAIKKFGLEVTLEADPDIFDESFLILIANVLNNTFLYDCQQSEDSEPPIVKLLTVFFENSETAGADLINAFIRAISRISWGPVPLFWILLAIDKVKNKIVHNVWTPDVLGCVRTLIEKNLTMHSFSMRCASQSIILSGLSTYALLPSNQTNLTNIMDTLSVFPAGEMLIPASFAWVVLLKYLERTVEPPVAGLYVAQICDTFPETERNGELWARSIVLLLDSERICTTNACPAGKSLHNLFQNLVGADLRLYADTALILRILEFWSHLINLASVTFPCGRDATKRLVSPYGDAIVKILIKSLDRKTIVKCDEYLLAIAALIKSMDSLDRDPWWPDIEKQLERIEDKCIYIICNPTDFCKTQWSYAIKALYLCRERTFARRTKLAKTYILPLLSYFNSIMLARGHEKEAGKESELPSGRYASDCFETIAKLIRQVITESPLELWPSNVHWFQELKSLVETGNEETIEPVADTLFELLEKSPSLAIQDLDTLNLIIRESWRCVFQLKRTRVFFSAVEQLARVIINSNFLKLDGAEEFAIECASKLMKEGERVPSLKLAFLSSVNNLSPHDVDLFRKSLVSCLLHGPVPRRDQRIEREAFAVVDKRRLYTFESRWSATRHDTAVRSGSVVTLLYFLSSPGASELRRNVLMDLLHVLEQNKNKRYFDNSLLHRLKQRTMQTLLVMQHFLGKEEAHTLHDAICDLLVAESNQPSVRLMQEWLVSLLHAKELDFRDSIWALFATAAEKRPGSIVSLANIVFHTSRMLREDEQADYISKAISHLLPNCMGQQFNVRLYSQVILVKMFRMLPAGSSEANQYREILKSVEESLRRGNLMKNSTRVLDNFYYTSFHGKKCWNLRTIYHDWPRLTNVSNDEWIPDDAFDALPVMTAEAGLSLFAASAELADAKPMMKSTKATEELGEETGPAAEEGLSDIQKKIIPWKSMVPFYDELSETSKATLTRRKIPNEDAGIIVVASLIDRPPNLGGLARTCEIFGAKEFVMASLRYAEDREFQTLSVSAEKWIPITEVKPHLLQNYLLEKQSEGWKLIGAEQTANSTNLLEMEFDKKTILLLGNEKNGIPANLIPLLDTCVEIPQNGVVRSLNVHVTGAICIWQYAKQHIFA